MEPAVKAEKGTAQNKTGHCQMQRDWTDPGSALASACKQ